MKQPLITQSRTIFFALCLLVAQTALLIHHANVAIHVDNTVCTDCLAYSNADNIVPIHDFVSIDQFIDALIPFFGFLPFINPTFKFYQSRAPPSPVS